MDIRDIRVVKRSIIIPLTVNVLPGTKYMVQNDECALAWSLLCCSFTHFTFSFNNQVNLNVVWSFNIKQ